MSKNNTFISPSFHPFHHFIFLFHPYSNPSLITSSLPSIHSCIHAFILPPFIVFIHHLFFMSSWLPFPPVSPPSIHSSNHPCITFRQCANKVYLYVEGFFFFIHQTVSSKSYLHFISFEMCPRGSHIYNETQHRPISTQLSLLQCWYFLYSFLYIKINSWL